FFLFKSPKYNQMVKKKRKLISNLKSSKKKGLSQFVLRQPLFCFISLMNLLVVAGSPRPVPSIFFVTISGVIHYP
ncbi:MAG: hypothetical protein DRI72_08900, partial [Bacteroidetes bacterium]